MSKKDFSVALKYVEARPRSQRRKGAETRVSGISVVGSGASATDLSLLQANLISVTNNFTALKDLFDSMFEKDSDGNIHAKLSLWSSGGITAGEVGSGGSGGGGISYNRLDSWSDYSAEKAGYVLSALLGKDLDNRVSALANAGYVTQSALAPYALRSEIPSLEPYFLTSNFTKSNIKATLGISDWALASVKPTYTASEVGALRLNKSSSNVDLDTILGSKTAELTPFFQGLTTNNIGSARKGVLRMSYNGSESQLLFDHYSGIIRYRTIGSNPKDWAKIAFTSDIPTKLSQLTNDKINNRLTIDSLGDYTGLHIANDKELCGIRFSNSNTSDSGNLIYLGGTDYRVTNDGWTATYKLLHEGNYSNLLAGGTVNGSITATSFIGNLTGNADSANFVAKTYANENINFAKGESKIRLVSGVASNSTDLGFPKQYTAGLSVVSSYCGWQMVCYGSNIDYNPYYRSVTDKGVWGSWKQIAFLTDNVASATKLATPRTIWGQSFDGTGDINGAIDVSSVTPSLDVPVIKFVGDSYFDRYGNFVLGKGAGSFSVFNETWKNAIFHVLKTGNVAIGDRTADEKLHVHGNGKFTGALTANSLTIGGVTLTYDSVNEALCINGNMYALGGITAGGAGISTYSSLEARVARLEQQLNI